MKAGVYCRTRWHLACCPVVNVVYLANVYSEGIRAPTLFEETPELIKLALRSFRLVKLPAIHTKVR